VTAPISLIVAVAENGVIGVDGQLPWHLPDDLRHFKTLTLGKPIVMGRATFDSIGRALPGRKNIVLSRQAHFEADDCDVVENVERAIHTAGDVSEIMVIGGSQIYALFLPLASRVYRTRVAMTVNGDSYFPDLPATEWQTVCEESYPSNNDRPIGFRTEVLERQSEPLSL